MPNSPLSGHSLTALLITALAIICPALHAPTAARAADPVAALTPGSGQPARDRRIDGSECSVCPEMVAIPAGRFVMGNPDKAGEQPLREVVIARSYAVGRFEVTFEEWDACVAAGGCASSLKPDDRGWGRGRRPVLGVSWDDAKAYVAWLTAVTGKSYRLLSEAEWEYAARAGSTTRFAFGDTLTPRQARFAADRTIEVGQFAPNAFGLHDMHGNVAEWCEDAWHADYRGAPTDGSAWIANGHSDRRVVRGGWFFLRTPELLLHSASRLGEHRSFRGSAGIRVARSL